jgi:secreted Zn-dependent insulinase-like peptidase
MCHTGSQNYLETSELVIDNNRDCNRIISHMVSDRSLNEASRMLKNRQVMNLHSSTQGPFLRQVMIVQIDLSPEGWFNKTV